MAKSATDMVLIGKIVNAHGIRGDVKVKSLTVTPADVCSYTPILKSDGTELKIKLRSAGNSDIVIAHIDGVDDRTSAETLKGCELYTPKSSILSDESEILLSDLIGWDVRDNKSNNVLGRIVNIYNFGAGDILEIQLSDSGKMAMMSYNKNSVLMENKNERYIKIDSDHLLA